MTKASVLVYGSITEEDVTKEVPLTEGIDYKVDYSDNVNAGTAKITITGEGNYAKQKLEDSFEISPAVITSAEIKYNSMTYTGKVRTQTNATIVCCGDKILTKGTDYKITYENNIDPGTATMTINGNGNYTGTFTKTFSIRAKLASVTLKYTSLKYTGKARTLTNSTVVTATINGESVILRKGVDYAITYKNNLNAGTATMIVTGIGDYKGRIKKQFKITPVTIKSASISTIAKLYTGSNITPTATVKAKVNGETVKLQKGTDYTVTYKNNKNVGTATVTIKGTGNFTGTITKTFSILQSKITGSGAKRVMSVAPVAAYGSLKVAVWTTKDGQDDIKWYTMKQYSSGNWKAAIKLSDFKDYGEVHAHVYSDAGFVYGEAFTISNTDWLDSKSNAFKNNFLYNSGAYENIDYVQCAVNIANNDYYGYGHTWRTNSHTISCAGLVGLSLTYCGYGDFIKDDPVEQLDGRRWGYIDLGTYSGKYNWMEVMMNEVGASWWSGISGIKIGDILYYDYGINNNHTAIYLGNGITVEARGPFGASDYDDSGVEVAVYHDGLSALPWQGYFSITNKRYI